MTLGIPDPAAHWAQSQQEWQGKTVYILSHANQRIAVIETGTLFASGSLYAEDDAPERAALAQMVNLLALAKNLQGD